MRLAGNTWSANELGAHLPGKVFELTAQSSWKEFDSMAKLLGVKNNYADDGAGDYFRAVPIDERETIEVIINIRRAY